MKKIDIIYYYVTHRVIYFIRLIIRTGIEIIEIFNSFESKKKENFINYYDALHRGNVSTRSKYDFKLKTDSI